MLPRAGAARTRSASSGAPPWPGGWLLEEVDEATARAPGSRGLAICRRVPTSGASEDDQSTCGTSNAPKLTHARDLRGSRRSGLTGRREVDGRAVELGRGHAASHEEPSGVGDMGRAADP